MYKFYAVSIGMLIAVMVTLNGILAENTGDFIAGAIIHAVGLITVILLLLLFKLKIRIDKNIPLYLYSAGAIGIIMVLFNNICYKEFGASMTLAFGLLGQSIASVIIDHFGLFGMAKVRMQKQKFIGFFIITIGIIIMYFI